MANSKGSSTTTRKKEVLANNLVNYYNSNKLTQKQLDTEFSNAMYEIGKAIPISTESEKVLLLNALAVIIGGYIETKVEREIERLLKNMA